MYKVLAEVGQFKTKEEAVEFIELNYDIATQTIIKEVE